MVFIFLSISGINKAQQVEGSENIAVSNDNNGSQREVTLVSADELVATFALLDKTSGSGFECLGAWRNRKLSKFLYR